MMVQELQSDSDAESPKSEAARRAGAAQLREFGTPRTPAADGTATVADLEQQLAETTDELKFLRERCVQFEVKSGITLNIGICYMKLVRWYSRIQGV